MALRSWIHKKESIATATVATPATVRPGIVKGVAKVAGVAVAEPQKQKISLDSMQDPPRQVVCQAFEHNGVLMSTSSKHCIEWQCQYCEGCELF